MGRVCARGELDALNPDRVRATSGDTVASVSNLSLRTKERAVMYVRIVL